MKDYFALYNSGGEVLSKFTVVTGTAPSHWAPYLINSDTSGMDAAELAQADKFIEWLGALPVTCEDAGFMWTHDATRICGALASDCQIYTAKEED